MQVIRHETEDNDQESMGNRGCANLIQGTFDHIAGHERPTPKGGADCQEIPIETKVIEPFQALGSIRDHASASCNG